ncbi:helix-turn-helix transcriptional regulator [Actinomadura sp. LOL_016]|uniref:helix-turn-helix domain-containing protein n=1 Tax=unclassified Actinomadura TaxID=2626254 RepID=UPI003A7FACC1
MGIVTLVEYLFWVAVSHDEHELAAVLLGGAATLWRKVGKPLWGEQDQIDLHTGVEDALMLELGAERFTRTYGHGTWLPCTGWPTSPARGPHRPRGPPSGSRTPVPWASLTPREREVAHLIAEGLNNLQIAERLVISNAPPTPTSSTSSPNSASTPAPTSPP